jgi:hypothetical protein
MWNMEGFVWAFALLSSLEISAPQTARFAVDDLTRVTPTVVATVEPRADAPGSSWIRMYFYSFALTPIERQRAALGRDPALLRQWEAILQLTVDPKGTVAAMDLALPGRPCAVAQTGQDAARAVQHFEFDGVHLRLKSKAFSICDLKVEGVPSQRFEWDVTLDTPLVARASSLK